MIERGAEVYYQHPVKTDSSPILFAVKSKNLKVLEMICDRGIDIDQCKNT